MRKILPVALALSAFLSVLTACASEPPVIPESLSSAELIQRAQEASDKSDWTTAITYYETARARFDSDPNVMVTCDYETAFIHYKQGKYELAEKEFLALIAQYDTPEGAALPPSYLILARKVLPVVQGKLGKTEKTE